MYSHGPALGGDSGLPTSLLSTEGAGVWQFASPCPGWPWGWTSALHLSVPRAVVGWTPAVRHSVPRDAVGLCVSSMVSGKAVGRKKHGGWHSNMGYWMSIRA